jgi:hypothetical protein
VLATFWASDLAVSAVEDEGEEDEEDVDEGAADEAPSGWADGSAVSR